MTAWKEFFKPSISICAPSNWWMGKRHAALTYTHACRHTRGEKERDVYSEASTIM